MKRKWMALALALGLAAGMAGCGNQSAPSSRQASSGPVSETMNPYNLHQVVAENDEKGRTIMWELPSGKDNSLEYRKRGPIRSTPFLPPANRWKETGVSKRYRIYGKAGSSGKGRIL